MAVTHHIFLLLGSNLGDREKNMLLAIKKINEQAGTVTRMSSLYRTQPWGLAHQPEFLNQVLEIESPLLPHPLLLKLQSIEMDLGRKRTIPWGPRTMDIDILFFGNEIVDDPDLIIPHAGLPGRRFTLLPLCEIVPDFVHPVVLKTCQQLLAECRDTLRVELFDPTSS